MREAFPLPPGEGGERSEPGEGGRRAKTVIQRQIDTVDRQIDRLVYELYDLTEHEIAIVEEAME